MFIFRVTGKMIDHFEVFPGYAIRRRFFRIKHKSIEVVCQDHPEPDNFSFSGRPSYPYKKCRFNMTASFIFFLLYYITCTILYGVDVVKNAENIEINEKA
jgi:hypothetical protein